MPFNRPITDWHGKSVWVIGASSGIGQATAHALHGEGARVFVSARSGEALEMFALTHRGATAVVMDVTEPDSVKKAACRVLVTGPLDLVVYCAGYYTASRATAFDVDVMLRHQAVNYVGALNVIGEVLPHFLKRQSGHISLVSSVAGYRGLPQSLAYGPTKAALINLAETMYGDLQDSQVNVSLICPGFVETPLTANNDFKMPGLLTPAQAAAEILHGWRMGKFEIHFPKRFTLWMKTLQLLPYGWYFRMIRRFTGL